MSFRNFLIAGTSLVLLASAAAAGGCVVTEDEEPSGSTYPYPTESAFCAALAGVECNDNVVTACFGSDESSLESDRSKCESAREAQCNPEHLHYNPEAAVPCLDARKAALTDAALTRAEIDAADEACLPVFSRGGASGASCTADVDCDTAGGLRCVTKPGQASGNCAEPTIAEGGAKCDASNIVCADGLYCNADAGDFCTVQPAEGEDCSAAAPCADGFKCSLETGGVCLAKAANGDACAADAECTGGFCTKPSGAANGTCTSTSQLASTSQSCDDYK
jgi:hypothetical protein